MAQQLGFERSVALLVGISDYQNGIAPLRSSVNDVEAVASVLKSHGYEIELLTESRASAGRVMATLVSLRETLGPDDRVIFYFAGHGIASMEEDGPQGLLVPHGAQPGQADTYLPMRSVYAELEGLRCRHVLVILDCCFAGRFRWAGTRSSDDQVPSLRYREQLAFYTRSPAWQVIASCGVGERALDILLLQDNRGGDEHSPFATALVEGLSGKADTFPAAAPGRPTGDGIITATELYQYIRSEVQAAADRQRARQTPCLTSDLRRHKQGEYVFALRDVELPSLPADSQNPYRALSAYGQSDRSVFFGRSQVVKALCAKVLATPLTVVLGASGSGKSSLVKAGLLDALGTEWSSIVVRPGAAPFASLRHELDASILDVPAGTPDEEGVVAAVVGWLAADTSRRLVLAVDQCEELITLAPGSSQMRPFFRAVAGMLERAPERLRFVATLRSEFEPHFAGALPGITWEAGRFVVPPMRREEMRDVVMRPALDHALTFEPFDLVDEIIDEVLDAPGALPLLSVMLYELYDRVTTELRAMRRHDRTITRDDFHAVKGQGASSALARRAEAVYRRLVESDPAFDATCRNLFMRMLSPGQDTRRRVPSQELEYPEPQASRMAIALREFSDARLVVTDLGHVEPAHEVLLSAWPRVFEWKTRTDLRLFHSARLAANDWHEHHGQTWAADPRLDQLRDELACESCWLNQCDRAFVHASLEERRRNEARWKEPLVRSMVDASEASWFARRELEALGAAIAATRQLRDEALAASAVRAPAWKALRRVYYGIHERDRLEGHTADVTGAAFTSDGGIVSASIDSSVRFWPADGGPARIERSSQGHWFTGLATNREGTLVAATMAQTVHVWENGRRSAQIPISGRGILWCVAVRHDGSAIAAAGDNGATWLLLSPWATAIPLPGGDRKVTALAFSPDGRWLATGDEASEIRFFDVGELRADGPRFAQPRVRSVRVKAGVAGLAFGPRPGQLAFALHDQSIGLWRELDPDQPLEPPVLFRAPSPIGCIRFVPSGSRLVTGSTKGTISFWGTDIAHDLKKELAGHRGTVTGISFSADGNSLVSASTDGSVRVWATDNRAQVEMLHGHQKDTRCVAFSPRGDTLVSGAEDGCIRIWRNGRSFARPLTRDGAVVAVAFGPSGHFAVASQSDGGGFNGVQLCDPEGTVTWRHPFGAMCVRISRNGRWLAASGYGREILLWRCESALSAPVEGPYRIEVPPDVCEVASIDFSPDERLLAAGCHDGQIRMWDLAKDRRERAFSGRHDDMVYTVAFDPVAGTRLASGGWDNAVRIWELDGHELATCRHRSRVTCVAYSPSADALASASADNTVQIWSAAGKPLRAIEEHATELWGVCFDPSGRTVATAGKDSAIGIFQATFDSDEVVLEKAESWMRRYAARHPEAAVHATTTDNSIGRQP